MNVFALISFLAFITCFFLGNFIYHKNPKNQLNVMILFLCLLVGILALVEFEYRQAGSFETAFFWLKISGLWPLVPAILLHISLIFTKSKLLSYKLTYLAIYLPALIISYLAVTTGLLLSGITDEYWGWTYIFPQNSLLFDVMGFWTVFTVLLAAFICLYYYLKSESLKRLQAKYIIIGLYLPFAISILSDVILPNMSVRIPEMTMTMSTVGIGFISYGVWKYRFPALTAAVAADEIVSTMSNFLLLMDTEMNILNVNQATRDLLGYEDSQLIGKSIGVIFPDDKEKNELFKDYDHHLMKRGFISNKETYFKTSEGKIVPVFLSISSIEGEDGKTLGIVCIGSDIVEITRAKNEIKASLEEKEILLQEVHHRVKNNLQIISSLLNLQSRYIKDENDLELFKDSQSRVKSMAFIHEQSYQSSNFSSIEFSDYINNLVTYLIHYYEVDLRKIDVKMDVDDVKLDLNTSIPCGLIVNELVSNSLKHAFPQNMKGEIYIGLHSHNDSQYTLIVADNGIGLPEDFNFRNPDTLGLQLVNGLISQLYGTLNLIKTDGTRFEINFNKLEYAQRI